MIRLTTRRGAAGVLPALAALAALLCSTPTAAHEPPSAPRAVKPASPPDAPSAARARVEATLPRPLADLVPQAGAVIVGFVARTDGLDDDRLLVHQIQVERVVTGQLDAKTAGLVDIRGGAPRPPILESGEHVLLVVKAAPSLSYLQQQLPPDGTYVDLVGGRAGIVRLGSDREADFLVSALTAPAPEGDAAAVRAATRARLLAWLAGPSPRLASDAVVGLQGLPDLAPLSPEELSALAKALADPVLAPQPRAALALLLGDRTVTAAGPALRAARIDDAIVLAAVLEARRKVGDPADRAELDRWLASDDPGVRAVAIEALVALPGDDAVAAVGKLATTDPDETVRAAAVDALGRSGRPEALPFVATTFDGTDRDIQQRSARAMLAIGGPKADETLTKLALTGTTSEARRYAALTLLVTRGKDSPQVKQLLQQTSDSEVRAVLTHGLEFGHRHNVEEDPDHTH